MKNWFLSIILNILTHKPLLDFPLSHLSLASVPWVSGAKMAENFDAVTGFKNDLFSGGNQIFIGILHTRNWNGMPLDSNLMDSFAESHPHKRL